MLPASRRVRRRLSLAPLVDVIFLLLLFFMLSSTFMRFTAVDIATAASDASATQGASGAGATALLKVRHDGTLSLNGTGVEVAALSEALATLGEAGTARVLLTAEAGVSVQALVTIMEEIEGGPLPIVLMAGRSGPRSR